MQMVEGKDFCLETETIAASTVPAGLPAIRVYALAALGLAVGLAAGYLLRVPQKTSPPSSPATAAVQTSAPASKTATGPAPSLAQMQQLAGRQLASLLTKLKSDPNNSDLLGQIGTIYHTSHQFKQAAQYYGRAVAVDPGNVALRTKLAASLYRDGDADGAIAQLNQALSYDSKDANALFDLGMIKLHGKQDAKGALAAWRQLLKSNPQLSAERKATVRQLIEGVQAMLNPSRPATRSAEQ